MAESNEISPPDEGAVPLAYPTPVQSRLLWTALTALAVTLLVGVAGLVFLGFISFLSWSYPVLLPIGLAVIIALVLEPVVNFLQKRGIKRRTGTLGTCLMAVVAFLLFWVFLLPSLAGEAGKFLHSLPGLISEGVDKLENLGVDTTDEPAAMPTTNSAPTNQISAPALTFTNQAGTNFSLAPVVPPPVKTLHSRKTPPPRRIIAHSEMQDWVKTNLPLAEETIQNNVAHLVYTAVGPVGQALGFLLGFGFVPIYVYYFLADQEDISDHWHEYVPLRRSPLRDEVVSVVTEINAVLVKYFRGQIVVAACNGLLTSIGLIAIGIPYGLILGIITGALSIVPFLGIIISILPALLLGFLSTGGGWVKPLLVLVVFALVQFCESMFITPRVQSHSTGLHPLTIIIGILFWSMLLPGLLGPVVAVPLTCSVVVLMRRYVWQIRR
jgi:predicted PurR-regulated permease PerM